MGRDRTEWVLVGLMALGTAAQAFVLIALLAGGR